MTTAKHVSRSPASARRVPLLLGLAAASVAAWSGSVFGAVYHVDVAVIGAGSAGLTAAIAAKEAGAGVIIFEKMPMVGGNTLRASGHLAAVGSKLQEKQGLHADPEVFYNEILEMGGKSADPELVRRMVAESGAAVDWLHGMGVDLGRVRAVPGTKEYRLFQPAADTTVGSEIINGLLCRVEMLGIPVQMDSRVVELTMKNGVVTGFKAVGPGGEMDVDAKAVVIATGGFASGVDLLERFMPEDANQVSTNTPGATGDGLILAEAVGSGFVDLDAIHYHPTAVPLTGRIVPEAIRFEGAILVDRRGRRFVNELGTSQDITEAIRKAGGYAWLVADRTVAAAAVQMRSLIMHEGVITGRDEMDLAQRINVPPPNLRATLTDYRVGAARGQDAFGRATFLSDLSKSPLYALRVRPALHTTTGGITINRDAEVLNAKGKAIPGLYAAGEVTGGVHGRQRLEDTALTDAVVYGRVAGQSAAAFANALHATAAIQAASADEQKH